MEEIKVRELPNKSNISPSDYIPIEDEDGTKKVQVKNFRTLVLQSLFFNNINDLKNSSDMGLKEGDICETLGYYTPGDGGGAKYIITYNPSAVEDGKLIHYLSYSDTLRAEIVLGDKINVHQFGATGDGVTDDSKAIQAAIDNSDERVVEFIHNKTYVTKNSIVISKDNTIINGNGAILYPHYVNGIEIKPVSENVNPVMDITINGLNFEGSRSTSAIYLYRAFKVNINNCSITGILSKGIDIKNSFFINIDNSDFSGKGSHIIFEGEDNDILLSAPSTTSRFINVDNCRFGGFNKAIHVLSTHSDQKVGALINIMNCHYKSESDSDCIYIACPIEMISIISNSCENGNFLYFGGASSGFVSCRDLSCIDTTSVFDIGATNGILEISGNLNINSGKIFEKMAGKLNTSINWNLYNEGSSYTTKPIGELFDSHAPSYYRDNIGYSIYQSTLELDEARNIYVDWSSSTHNIDTINNGIKGQLLYIKSSTNKSIIAITNKIVLSQQSIVLTPYNGVLLKYDGLKWVQI